MFFCFFVFGFPIFFLRPLRALVAVRSFIWAAAVATQSFSRLLLMPCGTRKTRWRIWPSCAQDTILGVSIYIKIDTPSDQASLFLPPSLFLCALFLLVFFFSLPAHLYLTPPPLRTRRNDRRVCAASSSNPEAAKPCPTAGSQPKPPAAARTPPAPAPPSPMPGIGTWAGWERRRRWQRGRRCGEARAEMWIGEGGGV